MKIFLDNCPNLNEECLLELTKADYFHPFFDFSSIFKIRYLMTNKVLIEIFKNKYAKNL